MLNSTRVPESLKCLVSSDIARKYRVIPVGVGSRMEVIFYTERAVSRGEVSRIKQELEVYEKVVSERKE